jgi:hypothetical protein
MQVETFEQEEVASLSVEASEEAITLMEKFNLVGQLSLCNTETRTLCPYKQLKDEEFLVYKTLCPRTSDLKDFRASTIPLRVLQIISHAKELGIFKIFRVCSAEGDEKDPVLVAWKENVYEGVPFILARWGEELDAWPELVKKAENLLRKKCKSKSIEMLSKIKIYSESIDTYTLSDFVKYGDPYVGGIY